MRLKKIYSKKLLLTMGLFLCTLISMAAPAFTLTVRATGTGNTFYYYLNLKNTSTLYAADKATNIVVTCPLPSGATFVSANLGGTLSGSNIVWNINNLSGKGMVTPTFICTASSGTITLTTGVVSVACSEIATVTPAFTTASRTFTAAGPVIEVSTTGNDATAAANLTGTAGNKSTAVGFPYKSWVAAMGIIKSNAKKCQTLKFAPGNYNDANNDVQSTSPNVNINSSNSWTAGNYDGLIIDGQGAEINGLGSTNNFFSANSVIKDLTVKNFIFSQFRDAGSGSWSVWGATDVDGLVVDNCVFYSSRSYQPFYLDYTSTAGFPVAVTISNCAFSGNSFNTETTSSGAMEIGGGGTANDYVVNLDKDRFTCNRRNSDGGALKVFDGVDDCRRTTVNLSECAFVGNTSSTTGSGGAGMYVSATASTSNPGSVNLYNTDFTGNILNGSTSALGGQFSAVGNIININGGTYKNGGAQAGTPGLRGGAMGFGTNTFTSVTNVTITGNYATSSDGAIRSTGTQVVATNSTINSNSGGATQITGMTFTGGAITTGTAPSAPTGVRSDCVIYANTLSISGNVFDDGNGYTDLFVNGTGVTATNAGTLYVALVSNVTGLVVGYATVNPTTGAYNITGIASGLATSTTNPPTFHLVLSTSIPSVGATITPTIPSGWEYTGENFGAPSVTGNDGTTNANNTGYTSPVIFGTTVTNLNFAINKIPVVGVRTSVTQATPSGTTSVPVQGLLTSGSTAIFTASDLETTISSINITGFPSGATSFAVGTTTYYPDAASIPGTCPTTTCAAFPATGGVTVPTNASGVPTSLSVDPSFTGDGDVVFPYTTTDAAGAVSAPGSATIPFSITLPISILHFKAKNNSNCTNNINLKLAAGSNCQTLSFEKSVDGLVFTSINLKQFTSNIVSDLDININDNNINGISYYRVKMLDFNGVTSYTAIIKVISNCGKLLTSSMYPNPIVNNDVTFKILASKVLKATIMWYDGQGRVVDNTNYNLSLGNNTIIENKSNLTSGFYTVKVVSEGSTISVHKVVKE